MTAYDIDDLFPYIAQYWSGEQFDDFLKGLIFDQIHLEEEQMSLREQLIPADYTLMDEEGIQTTLSRVKYPRSTAVYGHPEVSVIPVTVPKPDKESIEALILEAKAVFPFSVSRSPRIRAAEDAAAMGQMVATENMIIVQKIVEKAGASITVDPINDGLIGYNDLLKMEAAIKVSTSATQGREGEGGIMTHILLHPNDMELLQTDERVFKKIKEWGTGAAAPADTSPNQTSAQFYQIEGRRWWLISSNFATEHTAVAWDYNRFLIEAVKMEVEIFPFDEKSAGIGTHEGNLLLSMFGVDKDVYADDYNCTMTIES